MYSIILIKNLSDLCFAGKTNKEFNSLSLLRFAQNKKIVSSTLGGYGFFNTNNNLEYYNSKLKLLQYHRIDFLIYKKFFIAKRTKTTILKLLKNVGTYI